MKNTKNKRDSVIEVYIDREEREWLVDKETGEMILRSRTKKLPKFSEDYYGLDTELIQECKTEDQLLEVVSLLDGYTKTKVRVNDTYLAENVIEGLVTPQQLVLLRHIAKNLCVWNIYIGTKQEMLVSGIDAKSLKRTLDSLKAFVRVEAADVPDKGCYRISINPIVAWKGDNQWRDYMKNKWYNVAQEGY